MLERGERSPPLETLEAMAKALKVSPLYLLQEKDEAGSRPRKRGRRGRCDAGTMPARPRHRARPNCGDRGYVLGRG